MDKTDKEIENLKYRIRKCSTSMYGTVCDLLRCKDLLDLLDYIDRLEAQIVSQQSKGEGE